MTKVYVTRSVETGARVWYSRSERVRRDGQPYDQDVLGMDPYRHFYRIYDTKLAPGERKCVELVEVRRHSR